MTKLQRRIAVALVVGVLVAWLFLREGQHPARPASAVASVPRESAPDQSHSQTVPGRPTSIASQEKAEADRSNSPAPETGVRRTPAWEIVSGIYGPLLDRLNLPAEVRERFLNLVCAERQAAFDVVSVAGAKNLSYLKDPTIERMALDAATSSDAEIRTLLTPEQFNQFIDYRNMRTIQVSVSRLTESASESGAPLTDAQVQGLINIFSANQTPGQLRRAPINAVLNLGGAGVTEPIITSARTLLSDPQLAALIALQADQMAPRHDTLGASPHPAGAR